MSSVTLESLLSRVIWRLLVKLQRVTNSFDSPINSLRNFAMDGFELPDASRRIVEVARKPRAMRYRLSGSATKRSSTQAACRPCDAQDTR